MPIPLLVPVLLALGLAASSDAEEDGEPGWEIDIPDGVFSELGVSGMNGFVDVDMGRRIVKAFTCVSGHLIPKDRNEVRLSIDQKYVSSDLRNFFGSKMMLESMRRLWSDGNYDLEDVEISLNSRMDAESHLVGVEYSPEEFIEATVENQDRSTAVELALQRGTEFFEDAGSWSSDIFGRHNKTIGTDEEKRSALYRLVRKWIYDLEPSVVSSDRPPAGVIELKQLLGLPSIGIRLRFFPGQGPSVLSGVLRGHELDLIGTDDQGHQVWDLFF